MKLKDIWDLAKVRAKDNLYTLILIEIIIIMIIIGLETWKVNLVVLFPALPAALMLQISKQLLMSVFWTGNIFACMMVAIGVEANVDYIFYVFESKSKGILWLLLRKILMTNVYMILFSCSSYILNLTLYLVSLSVINRTNTGCYRRRAALFSRIIFTSGRRRAEMQPGSAAGNQHDAW